MECLRYIFDLQESCQLKEHTDTVRIGRDKDSEISMCRFEEGRQSCGDDSTTTRSFCQITRRNRKKEEKIHAVIPEQAKKVGHIVGDRMKWRSRKKRFFFSSCCRPFGTWQMPCSECTDFGDAPDGSCGGDREARRAVRLFFQGPQTVYDHKERRPHVGKNSHPHACVSGEGQSEEQQLDGNGKDDVLHQYGMC